MDAKEVIDRIAEVAAAVGSQAAVGGSETAGLIVSVLARNPDQIDRFLQEGTELFIDGTMMPENGLLSWHAMNGTICTPQEMRRRLADTRRTKEGMSDQ